MSTVKEIRSVTKACTILETIAAEQPIGVSELARRTGIDKSAAHRLAVTLHQAGWLHRTVDGRWRIASSVGRTLQRSGTETLVAVVAPLLERLRDETGETAMLVAMEHGRLAILNVADSHHALRVTAPVGLTLPLANTSASRAIGAYLPPHELDVLRKADPSLDDHVLAAIRQRGWALNDLEVIPDARVVGAPVFTSAGYPVAAVIASAPTSRVGRDQIDQFGELALQTARTATELLRDDPSSPPAGH